MNDEEPPTLSDYAFCFAIVAALAAMLVGAVYAVITASKP